MRTKKRTEDHSPRVLNKKTLIRIGALALCLLMLIGTILAAIPMHVHMH